MNTWMSEPAAPGGGFHCSASAARRLAAAAMAAALLVGATTADAQGLPFVETFDDTSFRDTSTATATTADWGQARPGQLGLGTKSPLSSTFESVIAIDLPGEFITRGIALGDMDGDGLLDIVESAADGNGVYINSGGGMFATRVPLDVVANTRGIAVADMNRDGHLDIVAANFGGRPSVLYLNSGDGVTYEAQDVTADVRSSDFVVLADFNGDGHVDAATANHNERNRLYLNTGDPLRPFAGAAGQNIDERAANTQALAAGDLDNDGDLDLVSLNENQINHYHLNDGSGTFSTHDVGTDADDSQDGALADVNGDGWLDLIAANTLPGQANKVYLNAGAPTWLSAPTAIDVSAAGTYANAHSVVPADIDDDGDIDLVLSTAGSVVPPAEGNRVYINDGTGNFPTFVPIGAEMDMTNTGAVGDLDNDGDLDYVSGNESRDPLGVAIPFVSRVYLNVGASSGAPAVPQLRGTATSIRVDAEAAPIESVRLRETRAAGFGTHDDVEYWVSSDGGTSWVTVAPGVPVLFPEAERGQDLRWRSHLATTSPEAVNGAGSLAVDDVTLELNTSGPSSTATIGDQSATVGTPFAAAAQFSDPDGDPVRYSLVGLPDGTGLVIDPASGAISGTPTDADAAISPIAVTVVATDGARRAEEIFTLTVAGGAPANQPPTITLIGEPAITVQQGAPFTDPGATAADAEDGDLTADITVDNPVSTATAGTYTITYSVQDSAGATAQAQRTVTVEAPAQNPGPPANPPVNQPVSSDGGGGDGGGGSTTLLELLALALLGAARAVRRSDRRDA